tara:strand:- start:309 stop:1037 length:729 start_codon:yes stop_codon:yes gene_type:complete
MATIKINNVTALTESSGTITLDSGVTVSAAGLTGTIPNAVQDNTTRLGTVTTGDISAITPGIGVLLYTETYTSNIAEIDINQTDNSTLFSSTYHTYLIIGHNINYSSDSTNIRMRWEYNGAFKTDGVYGYHVRDFQCGDADAGPESYVSTEYGATYVPLSAGNHRNATYVRDTVKMFITRPFESSRQGMNWEMQFIKGGAGATKFAYGVGLYDASAYPITGVRFYPDQGTFTRAVFSVYGIR